MAKLLTFVYENRFGFQSTLTGVIEKTDRATGRIVFKAAPSINAKGQEVGVKPLTLHVDSIIKPEERLTVVAAVREFEAEALKNIKRFEPVAADKATLLRHQASLAAFKKTLGL